MHLYELIVEGYKEAQQEFASAESGSAGADSEVTSLIQSYKDLVNKNQVTGVERNIDYWRKQGFDAFKTFVNSKRGVVTKTAIKRKKVVGKSITLRETDKWLIVIPLDKSASCFHGKDSDWCTTKPTQSYFENYFYKGDITLIYCLNKLNGGMWAIATNKKLPEFEMFDKDDNSINAEQFNAQTGLNANAIVRLAHNQTNASAAANTRTEYTVAMAELKRFANDGRLSFKSKKIEELLDITRDPDYCKEYIEKRHWREHKQVDVPLPIIVAVANKGDTYILEYVDFSIHPESFAYRAMTKYDALDEVLRSGYKPSEELINRVFNFVKDDKVKTSSYVFVLAKHGAYIPTDILVDTVVTARNAEQLTKLLHGEKRLPSLEVQKHLVGLYPDAMYTFSKLGSRPDKELVMIAMTGVAADESDSMVGTLIGAGAEISTDAVIAGAKGDPDALFMCVIKMVHRRTRPADELLIAADKVEPGTLAMLMHAVGMQVPAALASATNQ